MAQINKQQFLRDRAKQQGLISPSMSPGFLLLLVMYLLLQQTLTENLQQPRPSAKYRAFSREEGEFFTLKEFHFYRTGTNTK